MQQQIKPTANQQMVQPLAPKKKAINKTVTPINRNDKPDDQVGFGMPVNGNGMATDAQPSYQGGVKTPSYLKPSNGKPADKPGFGMPTTPGNGNASDAPSKPAPPQTGGDIPWQNGGSNGQAPGAGQGLMWQSSQYNPVGGSAARPEYNAPQGNYKPTEYQSVTGNAPQFESNTPQTEFTGRDYQSNGYTGAQGKTDYQYDPRSEALVQNQITGLLDPNSALMRKAIAQAQNYSASRGLQSSSIGSETALSSMIDKALPIAQQDAGVYANADQAGWQNSFNAEQNNLSREHDASMFDKQGELNTNLQNDQLNFQNAQNNANREQQTELQQLQYKQSLGMLDAQGEQRMQELNAQQGFQASESKLSRDQQAELQDLQYKQSLGMLDAQGEQRMQELNAQQSFNLSTLDRQAEIQQKRDELMNQFDSMKMDKAYLQDLEKTKLTWEKADADFEKNLNANTKLQYQNATADAYNRYLEQVALVFSNPNMTPAQQNAGVSYLKNMFESQRQQMQVIYGVTGGSSSGQQTGISNPNQQITNPSPGTGPQLPIIPNASSGSSSSSSGGGRPGGNNMRGLMQR